MCEGLASKERLQDCGKIRRDVGRFVCEINHPVLGPVLANVPVKTYEGVSQFWTWSPEEFLKRGPYKR